MTLQGNQAEVSRGLKGVAAADSSICRIDGTAGRLLYRGYCIEELAESSNYEEVAWLLLRGELPGTHDFESFCQTLKASRGLPAGIVQVLSDLPQSTSPMAMLRTGVSLLGLFDPDAESDPLDSAAAFAKAVRLVGWLPTLVATIHALRCGQQLPEPDPNLNLAADFMRMLAGRTPTDTELRSMELILILHAEHGFNASTFAARVIAATLTDMHSAVTGAVGALKGKLHGGANTEVLKTLREIGSVDRLPTWISRVRDRKGKFMGFGHAVYQTHDPRTRFLRDMSRQLGEQSGETVWYDLSVAMEQQVTAAIGRNCNVDFYSASVQHYLGIPGDLFTCVFAASRVSGWCAHILEQCVDNKIIRPSSNYVGPTARPYVAMAERQTVQGGE